MGGSDESSIVPIFPRTDLWDFNVLCERSSKTTQKKKSRCMEINGACLDIIILYKGSSYFPISYFAEPIVFFVVCFVVVPCFWEVSTCPACGRRIFFRPLVSGHCPKCKSKHILFS